jgi:hypothetical protein
MSMAHQPRPTVGQLVGMHAEQAATSALAACARSARAPLRKTSVSGSAKVPGWESWKTLVSVITPSVEKWETSNTPTNAALSLHAVTNFVHSSPNRRCDRRTR